LLLSRLLIVSMIAVFLCVLVCSGVLFIFCLSLGFAFPILMVFFLILITITSTFLLLLLFKPLFCSFFYLISSSYLPMFLIISDVLLPFPFLPQYRSSYMFLSLLVFSFVLSFVSSSFFACYC